MSDNVQTFPPPKPASAFNCVHCHDTGRKYEDCDICKALGYCLEPSFVETFMCYCSNLRCAKCGKAGPNGVPVVSYKGDF